MTFCVDRPQSYILEFVKFSKMAVYIHTCTCMHITMPSAISFTLYFKKIETLFIFLFQYRKKTRLDLALCTSLNSRSFTSHSKRMYVAESQFLKPSFFWNYLDNSTKSCSLSSVEHCKLNYSQRASRMNARRRKVPIFRWMVGEWIWLTCLRH